MKKRKILLVILIIILLIIFSALAFIRFMFFIEYQYEEYTMTIIEIKDDRIVGEGKINYGGTRSIEEIEKYFEKPQYTFSTQNAKIKDANGKKIEASELKVGDQIKIINIKKIEFSKVDFAISPQKLDNVKSIKVLNNE